MTTATTSQDKPKTAKPRSLPWWTPRCWFGCAAGGWFRLLWRNRFDIDLPCVHIAVSDSLISFVNSGFGALQQLLLGWSVARTPIEEDPIFILGHWRTGTTLLHELLVTDPRFGFPTHYDCMAPNHFLITAWIGKPAFQLVLPKQRPMDNMALGWDRPQEEEFALCNLGVPSPYLTIAFPNHPPQYQEYLDLEGLDPKALAYWKKYLLRFIQQVAYRERKRMVLKSPTHTWRIKTLLEMFPQARFIHLVRDPYVTFTSTVHLWKSLYLSQGLQVPKFEGLEEHVFNTFSHMHRTLDATRGLVDPRRFHELRYEDLVADPLGQVQQIYENLQLGEFEAARPRLEEYLRGQKDYKTNRYEMDPVLKAEITRRWGNIIEKYGYATG